MPENKNGCGRDVMACRRIKTDAGGTLLHVAHEAGAVAHEAGADEGIEAGVALALAGVGVDGCVLFGTTELLPEAGLPVAERGEVFFGGECTVVCGGIGIRIGSEEDAFGFGRCGSEAVLALQLLAGGGVLLPVPGMPYCVRLRCGFIDDATFVVAIGFAAVDDAASLERSANIADRVEVIDLCHIIYGL